MAGVPATTPDSATDFLGLGATAGCLLAACLLAACLLLAWVVAMSQLLDGLLGFALLEERIEAGFEFVVADAVVELFARLHKVDNIFLMPVAPYGGVNRFSCHVHGAEGRYGVEHQDRRHIRLNSRHKYALAS